MAFGDWTTIPSSRTSWDLRNWHQLFQKQIQLLKRARFQVLHRPMALPKHILSNEKG